LVLINIYNQIIRIYNYKRTMIEDLVKLSLDIYDIRFKSSDDKS